MKKHFLFKVIFLFLLSSLFFNCPNPGIDSYPPDIVIDDDTDSNNDEENETVEDPDNDVSNDSGEEENSYNENETEVQYPEITSFSINLISSKLRMSYATQGTIIGSLGDIGGGTPPFTYLLLDGNGINDIDNGRFIIDDMDVKIKDTRLSSSTYYFNLGVIDSNNKSYSIPVSIIIYPDPVSREQENRNINLIQFMMRYIPSGSFYSVQFGDDKNYPEIITLSSGYWMSEIEVTQELFQSVMGYNPSMYNNFPASGDVQNKRPVENISFVEAIIFCNRLSQLDGKEPVYKVSGINDWLTFPNERISTLNINSILEDPYAGGYRIPSEFEWQWAAIGADIGGYYLNGFKKHYSGGTFDSWDGADDYVWHLDNSDWKTHEVGKKLPNEMGLYDMSGNVLEYVSSRRVMGACSFFSNLQFRFLADQYITSYPQTLHNPAGIRLVSNR